MKKGLFRKVWMTVAVLTLGAVVPGVASADTSLTCPTQVLSQPFLSSGDSNQYTLLPGESADNFAGTGWSLSSTAKILTSTLADGTSGQVLDLPSGASALSPVTCVSSAYPTIRSMLSDVSGSAGVTVQMQLYVNGSWKAPTTMGAMRATSSAWAVTNTLQIHSASITGTTPARFLLLAGKGEYRVYNLYADPRYMV